MQRTTIPLQRQRKDTDRTATLSSLSEPKVKVVYQRLHVPRIAPQAVLELASEAILLCDPTTLQIVCVNDLACRMLGYSQADLCLRALDELVRDSDVVALVQSIADADDFMQRRDWSGAVSTGFGTLMPANGLIRCLVAESGDRFAAISISSGEIATFAPSLPHVAIIDELTGLPTRTHLRQRLADLSQSDDETGCPFALLFVDLDGFKRVNDAYGHHAGDQVLACVAERLVSSTRPNDFVARYGGDEFIIVLPGVDDPNDVAGIVERINEALEQPIAGANWTANISVSVGVAYCDGNEESSESLIQSADRDMYRKKRNQHSGGKSSVGRSI